MRDRVTVASHGRIVGTVDQAGGNRMSDEAHIVVVDGELAGTCHRLPVDNRKYVIGRRQSCDLVLPVDSVSREHCYIMRDDVHWWVHDNGSANSTLLNGLPVEKARLIDGDVITLDKIALEFRLPDGQRPIHGEREFIVQKRPGTKYDARNSLIGSVIGGKYKALSVLGEGGMAMVYKARREEDGKLVAVKLLKGGDTPDPENLARFRKEFRTGVKLQHPNIMETYDYGEHNGAKFMVLEYIDGSSLQEILDEKGKLSVRAALQVAIQVTKALAHAYAQGIIHRDIKPENIMISRAGQVKVTDLGLAKEFSRMYTINITKTGEGIGTLHYMPPEQIEDTKSVDQRADIYSLGATLYECIGGQPPFDEVGVWKFIEAINHREPPALTSLVPDLPVPVWKVIEKSLKKKPADRYQSPEEFQVALEGILASVRAVSTSPTEKLRQ